MFFISTVCKIARVVSVIALATFLTPFKTVAENAASPPSAEKLRATAQPPIDEAAKIKAWHKTMSRAPAPKTGCHKASFPNLNWLEVPCATPPNRPYPRATGLRPEIVGNGIEFSAQVVAGLISSAEGSFASVTGVTSVTSSPSASSNFSLQLNTNNFATATCTPPPPAVPSPQCLGWEQFIFSNSGSAFIQHWLLNYTNSGAACPKDWNTFTPTATVPGMPGCWRNSQSAVVPVQAIANLAQLSLMGKSDGTSDTIIMSTATDKFQVASNPPLLNLSAGWNAAEFNIFGDCCSTQVNFNDGSTIVVEIAVDNGTSASPSLLSSGFTAETNNLTLVSPACPTGGSFPSIVFTESNVADATSTCQCRAPGERCVGSGDCCSGSCSGGICECLPRGSVCPADKITCCGANACISNSTSSTGICNLPSPPRSCDGKLVPSGKCSSPLGWRCCGEDGWTCGLCR